ncbi:hypothetical protein BJ878DRAFT_567104 [Calycina marina]|uniref:Uncharacterized protein n=1 Tax=Calycina marina TaxID=1763456 RepID=A0A9P8CFA4_9HELO|nr:hypothetical protein BJ878DRAFT_567104 [Calycina marina]
MAQLHLQIWQTSLLQLLSSWRILFLLVLRMHQTIERPFTWWDGPTASVMCVSVSLGTPFHHHTTTGSWTNSLAHLDILSSTPTQCR